MNTSPQPVRVEPLWFPLVKKFYQSHYPSGKPNKSEPIWVIKDGPTIIAAARLKPLQTCQILTALVTHPNHRHQGHASRLMAYLQTEFSRQDTFCFTLPELTPFYNCHAFETIPCNQLPEQLKGRLHSYQVKQPALQAMKFIGCSHPLKTPTPSLSL